MRTHIASIFTLLLASAAGCGAVDDGACPTAMQSDDVACTLDVCNAESGAWAHIPDDSICGTGMRCDPAGGCVAAGGLTGRAFLFAHNDHSGITVSVDGVEGATTTTDAMGNWSLTGLPTGTYKVSFAKDKYVSESTDGIAILPSAATSPPDVTLRHGRELGTNQAIEFNNWRGLERNSVVYSPDRKHAVIRYTTVGRAAHRAYKLDSLATAPVELFVDPTYDPCWFAYCDWSYPYYVTNTHVVWTVTNPGNTTIGQTIWSRPLDGGPATLIAAVSGSEFMEVVGTPNTYVVIRRYRPIPSQFTESAVYVVKADGSTPMGAPVWVQPDASHPLAYVVNNETHAIIGVNNSTASPPVDGLANTPLHRIDLATRTISAINIGFQTNDTGLWPNALSPDGAYLFGWVRQNAPNNWLRSYMLPVASGTPNLAPNYGTVATMYSDHVTGGTTWFKDSSGVVFQTIPYNANTIEGHLKVWAPARATSTKLVDFGLYANWSVHNKVVVYRDPSAGNSPLRVVSAHSASPVIYPLDTDGNIIQDIVFDDLDGMSSYVVWTQSVSSGSAVRAKIFSAVMPDPLVAAPTKAQLGGTLANTCVYEASLVDRTYWQLCQDTGTLSGFTQSTTTAGATTTMVRPGLIPVPDGDRIAYRRVDGRLYSSPNTGNLAEVTLVSALWDGIGGTLRTFGNWVLYTSSEGTYLHASNVNGTAIDEPLSHCKLVIPPIFSNPGPASWTTPVTDLTKATVLLPGTRCGSSLQSNVGDFQIPTTNLP